MVQRLRLCAPNAWGPSSIPGQETRLRVPQLKIPRATTKTGRSQIHKYFFLRKVLKENKMEWALPMGREAGSLTV